VGSQWSCFKSSDGINGHRGVVSASAAASVIMMIVYWQWVRVGGFFQFTATLCCWHDNTRRQASTQLSTSATQEEISEGWTLL